MPRFAANLTMLFNEVEFLDRFAAAAAAGFRAVEYLFPYAYGTDRLAEKLAENGLSQVLHNLPAGDWAAGERGIACLPERVGEFQDGVGRAIEYARTLGCPRVNSGRRRRGIICWILSTRWARLADRSSYLPSTTPPAWRN